MVKDQKGIPASVEVRLFGRDGKPSTLELSDPDKIGQGAFGKTFATFVKLKSTDGDHGNSLEGKSGRFAIKVCSDDNPVERDILKKLKHPNIIQLFFYNIINDQMYMVLELMDAKDLYELVCKARKENRSLGIYIKVYAYQIFRGLAYCDQMKVLHRDIKSENLLVNHNKGILKIADFGCGAFYDTKKKYAPYVGTREFRAPEQLMGCEYYTTKIDVWAGAIVLSELILHHPLFQAKQDSAQLLSKIMKYLGNPSDDVCEELKVKNAWERVDPTESLKSLFNRVKHEVPDAHRLFLLLKEILVYSPRKRIGAWTVLAHPFFDQLRDKELKLPNGLPLPPLRNFSEGEISSMTEAVKMKLVNS